VGPQNSNIERAGLVTAVEQAADGIVITDTSGRRAGTHPSSTRSFGTRFNPAGRGTAK
jgi:hypothetical protein